MFLPGCETPNAALELGELQGVRQPFGPFRGSCCPSWWEAAQLWAPVGSQLGAEPNSRGDPIQSGRGALHRLLHIPLLPHRPGRGLSSRFGKQSLVPRLVLGALPCRSWSSRWRTGPTTWRSCGPWRWSWLTASSARTWWCSRSKLNICTGNGKSSACG